MGSGKKHAVAVVVAVVRIEVVPLVLRHVAWVGLGMRERRRRRG